jgi:hypothetical protein
MLRKRFYFIALVLALLIPTAVVFAAIDSVTLGDNAFQVDLVTIDDNADSTRTYTYAVTGLQNANELSHWTLGIETCFDFLVDPQHGDSYTTVTDIPECTDGTYSCEAATYDNVIVGDDPTTGVTGIKFENPDNLADQGDTHVFAITVDNWAFDHDVEVAVKYGSGEPVGDILGPACGGPTAVSLSSSNAGDAGAGSLLPAALVLMSLLAVTTVVVVRRRQTTTI